MKLQLNSPCFFRWEPYGNRPQKHRSLNLPLKHLSPILIKNSPFFPTKDHGLVNKYFSERLAQLIWKDAVSSRGEVGALDFDPLYDA
jgi:hypothetical protein